MNRQPSVKEARVVVAGRLVAGLLDSFICGTMTNDNHSMIVSETAESYQVIHYNSIDEIFYQFMQPTRKT